MSDAKSSVLMRKISAAGPKADAFPDLAKLAVAAARTAETAISQLLDAELVMQATGRIAPLHDIIAEKPDSGFYYWLTNEGRTHAALIDIAPSFASAVTERLLGGALDLAAENAKPSALDFGMAESVVDILMPALRALMLKSAPETPATPFAAKRGARLKKEVLKERELTPFYAIAMKVSVEGGDAVDAFTLCLPSAYLDEAGLMRRARSTPAQSKKMNEAWTELLRQNVLKTEIDLSVVLDRIVTNVGELSRLKVGQVLELHPSALKNLDIAAATDVGPVSIARGRLGSYQTHKAVKLTTGISLDFLRGL